MSNLIETGIVATTHGINGEVKINPWSDSPDFLLQFNKIYLNGECYEVSYARVQKNVVLVKFSGIDGIDDAMNLVNKKVYIDKADVSLPEGTYYIVDLMGCDVYDIDTGVCYGKISDVLKTGANDVYVIKNGDRELLAPVIPDVVKSVDIAAKRIVIRPLKGLFE